MNRPTFPTARSHHPPPRGPLPNTSTVHAFSSTSSLDLPAKPRKLPGHISEINVGQEAQRVQNELAQVIQRLRNASSCAVPAEDDADTVDLSDGFMRRSADAVKLHMMKAKMRVQEDNMQKVTQQAALNAQQAGKLSAEGEALVKNIKNLKAFEVQQMKKIQDLQKETLDVSKTISTLTREIERIKLEVKNDTKNGNAENERLTVQQSSWDRLLSQNEILKSEVQAAKEDNRCLQETVGQQQRRLQESKRRHLQERKRCANVIQKRQLLLDLLRKRRDHVENSRVLEFSPDEFRAVFRPSSHDSEHHQS